jgi:transposase
MNNQRKQYPSDVSDAEWEFCAPYLTLMREDAQQREYSLRELFNAVRYVVKTGCQWRYLPHDFPPWSAVYQQARRWWQAKCLEDLVHDLREVLRVLSAREPVPSAAIMDSRTLISTPESGERAGYDGYKRRKGSKMHIAVDTLGHLLALRTTAASEQDRAQVGQLAAATQEATGQSVKLAYVDQGHTGEEPAQAARNNDIELEMVKLSEAKRGFVLLPKRWVVERTFGWLSRFRRLARDYERLASSLESMHWLAVLGLFLSAAVKLNFIYVHNRL